MLSFLVQPTCEGNLVALPFSQQLTTSSELNGNVDCVWSIENAINTTINLYIESLGPNDVVEVTLYLSFTYTIECMMYHISYFYNKV